jgi:predicted metalloprotease
MTKVRSSDSSMIDDRRGQSGGGGGGLGGLFPSAGGRGGFPGGGGGGGGFPFPMKAGGGMLGIIMVLAAMFLPKLLGAGTQGAAAIPQANASSVDSGETCSSDLEQVTCGATVDVQTFWQTALPNFFGTEYIITKTVFFAGGVSTGCGNASSETGPFYCPLDSLVYIDLEFMQTLEQQLVGTTSDLAEQYIVAHEYGHHIQNVLGTNEQVRQAQQNDPGRANQYSVALELQADCYAGVWVGDVNARGLLDSAAEIEEALAAAAGVGDDRIQQKTQGRIDKEAWTHGSAEQRQSWFMRGFNTRDPRQCDTFNEVL